MTALTISEFSGGVVCNRRHDFIRIGVAQGNKTQCAASRRFQDGDRESEILSSARIIWAAAANRENVSTAGGLTLRKCHLVFIFSCSFTVVDISETRRRNYTIDVLFKSTMQKLNKILGCHCFVLTTLIVVRTNAMPFWHSCSQADLSPCDSWIGGKSDNLPVNLSPRIRSWHVGL